MGHLPRSPIPLLNRCGSAARLITGRWVVSALMRDAPKPAPSRQQQPLPFIKGRLPYANIHSRSGRSLPVSPLASNSSPPHPTGSIMALVIGRGSGGDRSVSGSTSDWPPVLIDPRCRLFAPCDTEPLASLLGTPSRGMSGSLGQNSRVLPR